MPSSSGSSNLKGVNCWTLKIKALKYFKTSRIACPAVQYNITEHLNLYVELLMRHSIKHISLKIVIRELWSCPD
jgi:hypothetical protein